MRYSFQIVHKTTMELIYIESWAWLKEGIRSFWNLQPNHITSGKHILWLKLQKKQNTAYNVSGPNKLNNEKLAINTSKEQQNCIHKIHQSDKFYQITTVKVPFQNRYSSSWLLTKKQSYFFCLTTLLAPQA